jgi:hypothetical protein
MLAAKQLNDGKYPRDKKNHVVIPFLEELGVVKFFFITFKKGIL